MPARDPRRRFRPLRAVELLAAAAILAGAAGKLAVLPSFSKSLVSVAAPARTPLAAGLVALEVIVTATLVVVRKPAWRAFLLLAWSALLLGGRTVLPMGRTCECMGLELSSSVSAVALALFAGLGALLLLVHRGPLRTKAFLLAGAAGACVLGAAAGSLLSAPPPAFHLEGSVGRRPGTYRVVLFSGSGDRATEKIAAAVSSCPCVTVRNIEGPEISLLVDSRIPADVTPVLTISLAGKRSAAPITLPVPLSPEGNPKGPPR